MNTMTPAELADHQERIKQRKEDVQKYAEFALNLLNLLGEKFHPYDTRTRTKSKSMIHNINFFAGFSFYVKFPNVLGERNHLMVRSKPHPDSYDADSPLILEVKFSSEKFDADKCEVITYGDPTQMGELNRIIFQRKTHIAEFLRMKEVRRREKAEEERLGNAAKQTLAEARRLHLVAV